MIKKDHLFRNTAIVLGLGYLIVFIAFYLQLIISMPEPVMIITEKLRAFYEKVLPPVIAAMLFFTREEPKEAIIPALILCSVKAVFYLPYSYLYYLFGYYYDSLESVCLGLFATVGEIATSIATVMLLYFVGRFFARRESKLTEFRAFDFKKDMTVTPLLQTSGAVNKGVFYICLTNFVYILGLTLYDILMFVISYSDIKLEEFITMALDISLVLAAFVISFIASIFVKNTVVKLRENNRV